MSLTTRACADLAPTAHAVLRLLGNQARGKARTAQVDPSAIAAALRKSDDSVRYAIEDLLDQSLVVRIEPGVYTVKEACVCRLSERKSDSDLTATAGGECTGVARSRTSYHSALGQPTDSSEADQQVPGDSREGTRRIRRSLEGIPLGQWTGRSLAFYFRREVEEAAALRRIALGPAPFNIEALSGSFARWRREDLTNDVIKTMVDLFVDDLARVVKAGIPAWKTFLAQRTSLYRKAVRATESEHRSFLSEQEKADYWTTADDESEASRGADYWIGDPVR